MGVRDIVCSRFPESRFISRGVAEGNKPGRGEPGTDYIPKCTYFICFIVPKQSFDIFCSVKRVSENLIMPNNYRPTIKTLITLHVLRIICPSYSVRIDTDDLITFFVLILSFYQK